MRTPSQCNVIKEQLISERSKLTKAQEEVTSLREHVVRTAW